MREINLHKVPGLNDNLKIVADDEPGPGGANHRYYVIEASDASQHAVLLDVRFQNGGIKEVGVNGPSNEALLAIVMDRVEAFQAGKFACVENAHALAALKEAMGHFQQRTLKRVARGVEGQLKP